MVVMGLNTGFSSSAKQQQLKELYTRQYFQKRASRILLPFFIAFLASLLIGFVWLALTGINKFTFNAYSLIGLLPVTGKGNYFITLLLQSILFLPIIGYGFAHRASLVVVLLVVLEVLFLLASKWLFISDKEIYLYNAAFPRYFSAIALGLALSKIVPNKVKLKEFLLLVILAIAACFFLYQLVYSNKLIGYFRPEWQIQTVLTFGYAALLVYVCFWLLHNQSKNLTLRFFSVLGKASYHIFLAQVIYFGLLDKVNNVWLNLPICIVLGYMFYRLEPYLNLFNEDKAGSKKS